MSWMQKKIFFCWQTGKEEKRTALSAKSECMLRTRDRLGIR
jgi:hypothetical protein